MKNSGITTKEMNFDEVLSLALRLPPVDQARLIARLAPQMEELLKQVKLSTPPKLQGILADLGPAPSAEDIDEARHDW